MRSSECVGEVEEGVLQSRCPPPAPSPRFGDFTSPLIPHENIAHGLQAPVWCYENIAPSAQHLLHWNFLLEKYNRVFWGGRAAGEAGGGGGLRASGVRW